MIFALGLVVLAAAVDGAGFAACPNLCSGHGNCPTTRECECIAGWTGADCSLRTCPFGAAWTDAPSMVLGIDSGHNQAECSNRGVCDRVAGECICEDGRFDGAACERNVCPNVCTGRGRCQSMQYFASKKDKGLGVVFPYEEIWDSEKLFGCVCDSGQGAPDCSQRKCPTGDDPLTGTVFDTLTQSVEWQNVFCKANSGTATLTFRGFTTAKIPFDASESEVQAFLEALDSVHDTYGAGVSVSNSGQDFCSIKGVTTAVRFLQDFGNLPLLFADGSKLGLNIGSSGASIKVTEVQAGSKEDDICSNRGICDDESGNCGCNDFLTTSDGFGNAGQRGDCGHATQAIQSCPEAESPCNLHGKCRGKPTFRCDCQAGWTGSDCSLMTCPLGKSWFARPTKANYAHMSDSFVECSNMGICDRAVGACSCMDGFEGGSCNVMTCPGDPTCSSHGECLTMAQIALRATLNGDETAYTYGATPNTKEVWDADMTRGCACDQGYEGYDCSLMTCASGDNPHTKHQNNEVQTLTCTHDGNPAAATVKFTFRTQTTVAVKYTATLAQLETALEKLSSVHDVNVSGTGLTSTSPICTAAGTSIKIEFLSPTGDVPLIRLSTLTPFKIDDIAVVETTAGTKEDATCSGKGLCNQATGKCACFNGFGSSDGQQGPGTLDDCGYVIPYFRCPEGGLEC
ncbi:tenascin-like protein [Pelagophyceae sp. CCMP2097]|nr:tenascin-like protein [Pelagophyceae sp. CCMP2097]